MTVIELTSTGDPITERVVHFDCLPGDFEGQEPNDATSHSSTWALDPDHRVQPIAITPGEAPPQLISELQHALGALQDSEGDGPPT